MPDTPDSILLTGASGFLGCHLLDELLRQTRARVYCLIRAEEEQQARQRIRQKLEQQKLSMNASLDRIIPVCGDLSREKFALSDQVYAQLSNSIDSIYHCAASTNFIFTEQLLKAINIDGTQHIIDFAGTGKNKAIHYISSSSIFLSGETAMQSIKESDHADIDCLPRSWGYPRTKVIAENLILQCRQQGICSTIFRPWFIGPHSDSHMAGNDFILRMIEGCIKLGGFPDLDMTVNVAPMDYVKKAIVHLSEKNPGQHRTYHIGNPHPISWNELGLQLLRELRQLKRLDYSEWYLQVRRDRDNPAYVFTPLLPEPGGINNNTSLAHRMSSRCIPRLQDHNTVRDLAGTGISCPMFDGKAVLAYLRTNKLIQPNTAAQTLEA